MCKWPIYRITNSGKANLMVVSKRDKLQDININNLKLEVHDTYKKDEKLTTNFEPVDNEDVINEGYLDENC